MMQQKDNCVVLLSGGLDSTVNLYEAHREHQIELALTFDYGLRAAQKEIELSQKICEMLGVPHKVIELPFFKDFTKTSLVNRSADVPTGVNCNISDFKTSMKTAKLVWVPNRNGIFINIASGFAEGLGASFVIVGFNAEEGATFPDNTQDFLTSLDGSLKYSTATQVKVKSYTTQINKTEIVQRGMALKAPFDFMWPCYDSASVRCGQCESCQRFERALDDAVKFRPMRDLEI